MLDDKKQASMGSAVSSIHRWTRFAADVLDYDTNEILLPKMGQHVVWFVVRFRNAGMDANYLGVIGGFAE